MKSCEDCGTRLELNGTCPNCHEELFIATWQAEYVDYLSEEFSRKIAEQEAAIKRKK